MAPRVHKKRVGNGDCASCHMPDYYAAGGGTGGPDGGMRCATSLSHTSPYYFPTDCALCHVETDWCDVPIDRVVTNHEPSFSLTGGHTTTSVTDPTVLAQCVSCHVAPSSAPDHPDWTGLSTDCATCHAADVARANAKFCAAANPRGGHDSFVSSGLQCQDCHLPNAWWPAVPGLHVGGRISSRHGGTGCQGCHDLSLLALQYPGGVGALGQCNPDGSTIPATPYQFPVCNGNNTCPECNCVQCHAPRGHDRNADYASCLGTLTTPRTANSRESMCWECHTNDFGGG